MLDDAAPAAAPEQSPAPAAPAPAPAAPEPSFAEREAASTAALDADLGKVWDKAQDETTEAPAREIKRAPDGKFMSAKPPIEGTQPAPEQAADENGDKPTSPAEVAAPAATEAPKWWSPELQERFKALPPEVAKPLAEQALQDRQTISKLGNIASQYEPLNRILAEHKGEFEQAGVHPFQGIQQLLKVQQALMNPATRGDVYRYLMQNYPADLGQALDGLPPDPQLSALETQVRTLRQELNGYKQRDDEARQAAENARQAEAMSEIEKAEKTLPDFALLTNEIMLMLPVLKQQHPNLSHAEALKLAHERAGWANPTVRAKWEQEAVNKRMKAAAEAAEKAKRQNGLNVSSKQKQSTPTELDDALASVWDKHNAA